MNNLIPCFSTHYSIGESMLTLEEAGKSSLDGPTSVCDLAKNNNLENVLIVDERIDGFIEAYKNFKKINVKLIFGIKFIITEDINEKTEESLKKESKIIILCKNTNGYNDLIKIWNKAWTDGFYYQGRLDWALLKNLWTENLILVFPFFSSFVAKNILTFNKIVPDIYIDKKNIIFFNEIDSGLPFHNLLENGVKNIAKQFNSPIQPIKTIYYNKNDDFKAYQVYRSISKRSSFERPNISHLSSFKFSFEEWLKLKHKND